MAGAPAPPPPGRQARASGGRREAAAGTEPGRRGRLAGHDARAGTRRPGSGGGAGNDQLRDRPKTRNGQNQKRKKKKSNEKRNETGREGSGRETKKERKNSSVISSGTDQEGTGRENGNGNKKNTKKKATKPDKRVPAGKKETEIKIYSRNKKRKRPRLFRKEKCWCFFLERNNKHTGIRFVPKGRIIAVSRI